MKVWCTQPEGYISKSSTQIDLTSDKNQAKTQEVIWAHKKGHFLTQLSLDNSCIESLFGLIYEFLSYLPNRGTTRKFFVSRR